VSFFWDFNQDGVVDSTEPNPTATFASVGSFGPSLRVVDSTGRAATVAARVVVGNTPPVVSFAAPQLGDAFSFGQTINYEVTVEDDQPFVCSRVEVTYFIGHDTHPHAISTAQGCRGSIDTPPLDAEHAASGNVIGGFFASYQDVPGPGLPPLESTAIVQLLPTPLGPGQPDAGPAGNTPDASAPIGPDAGAPDASTP
jgi:PKD repeat protein